MGDVERQVGEQAERVRRPKAAFDLYWNQFGLGVQSWGVPVWKASRGPSYLSWKPSKFGDIDFAVMKGKRCTGSSCDNDSTSRCISDLSRRYVGVCLNGGGCCFNFFRASETGAIEF